jgi:hypothetical protein
MMFISSEKTGSVYKLDPITQTELYYTPLMKNGDFMMRDEDWCAVDWDSVLGEEDWLQPYLKNIHNQLLEEVSDPANQQLYHFTTSVRTVYSTPQRDLYAL